MANVTLNAYSSLLGYLVFLTGKYNLTRLFIELGFTITIVKVYTVCEHIFSKTESLPSCSLIKPIVI